MALVSVEPTNSADALGQGAVPGQGRPLWVKHCWELLLSLRLTHTQSRQLYLGSVSRGMVHAYAVVQP